MADSQERVSKAEASVKKTESLVGKDHVDVSYALDELALELKAAGRLLEAANAAAKSRAIRTAHLARQSEAQARKFGNASGGHQDLSATGWLRRLYRVALGASAGLLVVAVFVRTSSPEMHVIKELVGSGAAATFLQLLVYPFKAFPRVLKVTIVTVGTAVIWMIVDR